MANDKRVSDISTRKKVTTVALLLTALAPLASFYLSYTELQEDVSMQIRQNLNEQTSTIIDTLTDENVRLRAVEMSLGEDLQGQLSLVVDLRARMHKAEARIDQLAAKSDVRQWMNVQSYPSWIKKCSEGGKPSVMVYINDAYTAKFKITRGQYVGRTDYDVWPEETADKFAEHDRFVCGTGDNLVTVDSVMIDGVESTVQTHKFPMKTFKGNDGVAGIAIECLCDREGDSNG